MRFLLAFLLLMAACSSFRETYREARNRELEGEAAPPIEGGTWIGKADLGNARWKVVAFFNPD